MQKTLSQNSIVNNAVNKNIDNRLFSEWGFGYLQQERFTPIIIEYDNLFIKVNSLDNSYRENISKCIAVMRCMFSSLPASLSSLREIKEFDDKFEVLEKNYRNWKKFERMYGRNVKPKKLLRNIRELYIELNRYNQKINLGIPTKTQRVRTSDLQEAMNKL